jgi:hypothetical protein
MASASARNASAKTCAFLAVGLVIATTSYGSNDSPNPSYVPLRVIAPNVSGRAIELAFCGHIYLNRTLPVSTANSDISSHQFSQTTPTVRTIGQGGIGRLGALSVTPRLAAVARAARDVRGCRWCRCGVDHGADESNAPGRFGFRPGRLGACTTT